MERSPDPKQRLPKEEAILDLDELVEDVADQPGALGVLVVDLQDVKAVRGEGASAFPRGEGERRIPAFALG